MVYCPQCGEKLLKYVYGCIIPNANTLDKDYVLGGCRVSEQSPNYYCKKCNKDYKI